MENVNAKYIDIAEAGKALFWKYGIKKVNVGEICEKADVSRATFYKYFDNKESLALNALKSVVEEGVTDYTEIMNSVHDFETKINLTIQLKIKGAQDISQEFLNDVYKDEYIEISAYFNRVKEENLNRLIEDYRQAQLDGNIRQDMKIEFILYLLNKVHEMVIDENLSPLYESVSDKIEAIVRFFFYGIFPREVK